MPRGSSGRRALCLGLGEGEEEGLDSCLGRGMRLTRERLRPRGNKAGRGLI